MDMENGKLRDAYKSTFQEQQEINKFYTTTSKSTAVKIQVKIQVKKIISMHAFKKETNLIIRDINCKK